MVRENCPAWADFEESFKAAASEARSSSHRSKAWMKHPVSSTDSITPMPPPVNSVRLGRAVSMDRWSKQIQIKTTKMLGPYNRANSGTEVIETKNQKSKSEKTFNNTVPGPIILVEGSKHERDRSRNAVSHGNENSRNTLSKQMSDSRIRDSSRGRPTLAKIDGSTASTAMRNDLSSRPRSRSATRTDVDRDYQKERANATTHERRRTRSVSRSRHTSIKPELVEIVQKPRSESCDRVPTHIIEIAPTKSRRRSRSSSQPRVSQERGRSSSIPPLNNSPKKSTSRSTSLTRATKPTSPKKSSRGTRPPSTYRTQREMRILPSPVGRSRSRSRSRTASADGDFTFEADESGRSEHQSDQENVDARDDEPKPKKNYGLREKFFGDQVERPVESSILGSHRYRIHPRVLLAATVYHNTATCLWITTINTNQRGVAKNPATANKFLKAFSFSTEREARASAIANAPPKMISFQESPTCFICTGKFAVFRRASHCRNCGVCVCNGCSISWPAKMIPATYNLKNEANVKICLGCNNLSTLFKKALLAGNYEESLELYGTGNINLRTPFNVANKKDELMWPVHCAVEGGNLSLLRWLIDDHFCPTKLCGGGRRDQNMNSPIVTSKGRSVLSIALECRRVEILRYLVVDCAISIYETKDLKSALGALEAALISLPNTFTQVVPPTMDTTTTARWDQASFDDLTETSSLGVDDFHNTNPTVDDHWTIGSKSKNSKNTDTCIICCEQKIDCVATPCGHQVCCLDCSTTLSLCPICNTRGTFIKIFKP